MAADGVADAEEMNVIRSVAEALDLDADEIEKMRQAVTLNPRQNSRLKKALNRLLA